MTITRSESNASAYVPTASLPRARTSSAVLQRSDVTTVIKETPKRNIRIILNCVLADETETSDIANLFLRKLKSFDIETESIIKSNETQEPQMKIQADELNELFVIDENCDEVSRSIFIVININFD